MAALPRVDIFFVFSRRVLALKGADEPPLREAARRWLQGLAKISPTCKKRFEN